MPPQNIFVGGAGRSGTTILLESIGEHPDAHSFPIETRFLVDKDGLLDLFLDLSKNYSLSRARGALQRFEHLMLYDLCNPHTQPYNSHDLRTVFGEEHYLNLVKQLVDDLAGHRFLGEDYPAPPQKLPKSYTIARALERLSRTVLGKRPSPIPLSAAQPFQAQPRYAKNSELLRARMGEFVSDLFRGPTESNKKSIWCEKTPHNLMHADFLLKLVPNSIIVHVYRDPRGIVQSLKRQTWAPDEVEPNCQYVEDFYQAWFERRSQLGNLQARLLEVPLEQLVINPEKALAPLWDLCGIANLQHYKKLDPEVANAWKKHTTPNEHQQLTERLEETILKLGYEL